MWYVIAILLVAIVYLFYVVSLLEREQIWQNRFLEELDKDLDYLNKVKQLRNVETLGELKRFIKNNII